MHRDPPRPLHPGAFLRGVVQTLAITGATAALGLGAAATLGVGPRGDAFYPSGMPAPGPEPAVFLVDGYNALHASVLGGRDRSRWWTAERRREVLARAAGFEDPRAEIWVVFDGPREAGSQSGCEGVTRLHSVFAPSADDWLVAQVRAAEHPPSIAVVTSDRSVAGRVRGGGAIVVSPGDFFARCPQPSGV